MFEWIPEIREPLGIGSGCGATLQVGHGGEFPSKNPQDTMALMVKTKYKHTCNGPIFAGVPISMQSKGLSSFVERLNRGVVDFASRFGSPFHHGVPKKLRHYSDILFPCSALQLYSLQGGVYGVVSRTMQRRNGAFDNKPATKIEKHGHKSGHRAHLYVRSRKSLHRN